MLNAFVLRVRPVASHISCDGAPTKAARIKRIRKAAATNAVRSRRSRRRKSCHPPRTASVASPYPGRASSCELMLLMVGEEEPSSRE